MDDTKFHELISNLKSTDTEIRWKIAGNKALLGDERFIEPLIEIILNDPEYGPRCGAAYTLSFFQSKKAKESLLKAFNDKDYRVRQMAVQSLYGDVVPEMIIPLITLFADTNREVAQEVPDTLSSVGEAALLPVMTSLEDENPQVRYYAILTLGKIGGKQALNALITKRDNDSSITPFGAKISDLASRVIEQLKVTGHKNKQVININHVH